MTTPAAHQAFAAAWQPQRPAGGRPRNLRDPIVEPEWGGLRVAAAVDEDEASMHWEGEQVPAPEPVLRSLLEVFRAGDAVIEGHLTTAALRSSEGAFPPPPDVPRQSMLVPRVLRQNIDDDPYIRTRDLAIKAEGVALKTLVELERGVPHAFVATDLLWLDGQVLVDVPLQERKRLLEAVLGESELVRVSAFVRPSAAVTLVTWSSLGFTELSYQDSNSRYLAGRENPAWVIAPAPRGPAGTQGPLPR